MTNKKQKVVDYVIKGGGAIQFHAIGEVFVSVFDAQSKKTNDITELIVNATGGKRERTIDLKSQEASVVIDRVYNEIINHGRK